MLSQGILWEERLPMGKIFEASELPHDEKIYLKKDALGWRIVQPPSKWYHYIFGSKRNIVMLIIIAIIAIMLYIGVNEMIGKYKDVAEHPCDYCVDCISKKKIDLNSLNKSNQTELNDLTIGFDMNPINAK